MKTGSGRAMFTSRERAVQTEAADIGERCARLKEEQEERCVSEQPPPLLVVKMEEDRDAAEGDRSVVQPEPGISLFAPVEFGDEAAWPSAPGQEHGAGSPRGRPKRRKRPKNPGARRPTDPAADVGMKPIEESDEADEALEQPPPGKCSKSTIWDFPSHQTSRSAVWEFFEYFINPEGELEDFGFPTCKLCQQKVACKRGNTSNMLRHLQENHAFAYWEAKRADSMWLDSDSSDSEMKAELEEQKLPADWLGVERRSEDEEEDDDDEYRGRGCPVSTPRRRRQVRSAVWHYFHYGDAEAPDRDRRPSCRICGWKLTAGSSGSTSNMRQHLQSHHKIICPLTKSTAFTRTVVALADGDDLIKLYPPSSPRKSPVWRLFGFLMNTEGAVEENGFPVCRLCHQVVASKDGNTSNMYSHLQHHHQAVYAELKLTGPAAPEQRQEVPESIELYPPEKRRNSPVWRYFGFIRSAGGELKEDGFPLCKLCYRRVAARDGTTSNMLNHLRRHHQAEYDEVVNDALPLDGTDLPELFPPSRLPLSPVWDYFGYPKNADGAIEENERPKCKACRQSIVSKQGILSNMLRHLKFYHDSLFEELKSRTGRRTYRPYKERSRAPPVQANPDELYPPKRALKSGVWKHFGYLKNSKGVVAPDGFPVCKLCLRKVSTPRGCTTNMMVHLQRYHTAQFSEMRVSSDDNDEQLPQPAGGTTASQLELFSPRDLIEPVWEHFGYHRDADGSLRADGHPTCKLCGTKVFCPGESSKFLYRHLWKKHNAEYEDMRVASGALRAEEGGGEAPVLFPPTHRVKSVAWEYFGYLKDAEGSVVCDGFPICKLCRLNIAAKGGNTTNLFKHLKDHHKDAYDEIRSSLNSSASEDAAELPDLRPPPQSLAYPVWEHFGFPKTEVGGSAAFDGFPVCRICRQRVESKDGDTASMFQHLKTSHLDVYRQIKSAADTGVYDPPGLRPASGRQIDIRLRKLFDSPKTSDDEGDGAPVCKICGQEATSSGGDASSMMKHLLENHESVYAEIHSALDSSASEDAAELPDLHPPPPGNLAYPVWEHFGFPKTEVGGSAAFDGFPVCRICRQRVESKDGDTANMFQHLKTSHLDVYRQIKPAVERRVYRPLELCPPNGRQIDLRLWEHFGYPKNSGGQLEEDGAPVCKICLQKLATTSKGGKLTTSMLRHLRRNHPSVYEELQEAIGALRPEWGNDAPELHPPTQNVTSPVWDYFGYLRDAEGTVVCDGFPICKICRQKVPSKGGNTTNMFKHLKDCHRGNYSEIRSAVTSERFEDVCSADDLHLPGGQHDALLWEHFGYRRNADGVLEEDGAPFCKLCLRKLVSRGETTRNMKQHLKENHSIVYTPTEEVLSSFALELDTNSSNLYPPTHKVKSAVWKFFGYPRDAGGLVLCDGFPVCKLCLKKVSAKGGNTTNMFTHLRDYHRTTYNEIKANFVPQRPEAELEPLELHLPTSDGLSPVWKYFGYPKEPDGALVCDGYPVCRVCQQRVIAKGGGTTYMLMHLRAYHLDIYKEVKPAVAKKSVYRPLELFPPGEQGDIKLWDHFGYPKDADGSLLDDSAPICKICLRKMIKSPSGATPTTNMLKHLRKKHQFVYNEVQEAITTLRTEWGIEPPELHPPTRNVTSAVWRYFGYLKDTDGAVLCDDFPICKLCQQKVASKRRCTTNMFKHLKDYHRHVYDEVRSAVTSQTFEDLCLPTDLHPPSGQHNPKLWEYFGYLKTEEGALEEDGAPICKLCFRKLISNGETTSNMMQHLKENHNPVYTQVQREVNPFTIGGATELPELYPPEHRVRSGVWKYFGYLRDTEGPAECAGYPICKICLSKVSNKGKVTANMSAHLKDHHRSIYDDLKIPDRRPKLVTGENLPELFPPSKRPLSPIWEHFGLPSNEHGAVEEDASPVCRICGKKVSSQDGRKMLRHLHFCHFTVYEELKNSIRSSKLGMEAAGRPSELHPPSKNVRSSVWQYFGYLKSPDGAVNVDGRPICKMCFQKVSSHGGNTTNMFKHLEDKHGFGQ